MKYIFHAAANYKRIDEKIVESVCTSAAQQPEHLTSHFIRQTLGTWHCQQTVCSQDDVKISLRQSALMHIFKKKFNKNY